MFSLSVSGVSVQNGMSPLMYACKDGKYEVAERLVELRADIRSISQVDQCSMMFVLHRCSVGADKERATAGGLDAD